MKILIISYYYPPETYSIIASLRPLSWAKYWSQQGYEIHILTTSKNRSITELHPYPNVTITEVSYNPFTSSHPKASPAQSIRGSRHAIHLQDIKTKSRNFLIFLQKILGAGTLLYASNFWIFAAHLKAQKLYQEFQFLFHRIEFFFDLFFLDFLWYNLNLTDLNYKQFYLIMFLYQYDYHFSLRTIFFY